MVNNGRKGTLRDEISRDDSSHVGTVGVFSSTQHDEVREVVYLVDLLEVCCLTVAVSVCTIPAIFKTKGCKIGLQVIGKKIMLQYFLYLQYILRY